MEFLVSTLINNVIFHLTIMTLHCFEKLDFSIKSIIGISGYRKHRWIKNRKIFLCTVHCEKYNNNMIKMA